MKVVNETHFSTRDLRRFFYAAERALSSGGGKVRKHIVVVYSRRGAVWGCASLGGERAANYMKFSLPKAGFNIFDLARVYRHERAHNLGIQHGEMESDLRYCAGPDPEWARGLTIGVREPKRKTNEEKEAARAARINEGLRRAKRRLQLAKTILKKWQKREKGQIRRLAAKAAQPKEV